MNTTHVSDPTSVGFRNRSVLEIATFTIFLVLVLLVLPVLSRLNAAFMTFYEAEMSTIVQMLNSIPVFGWLTIAAFGSLALWLKSRALTPSRMSFPVNLLTFLLIATLGMACMVMLVVPMFAILSALSA